MAYEQFRERVLTKDGKLKRILAIDGGGIRGLITIQFLRRIESIIRDKTGNPNALLNDYFHLIGGTSTGAVLSALSVIGRTGDEMNDIYMDFGRDVFKKDIFRHGILSAKYPINVIEKCLKDQLHDLTMGDTAEQFGVGFVAVTKRLDSSSCWPIDNNPDGKYFESPDGSYIANKDYPAWQVVRTSTAAPTYFDPELISIAADQTGLFVDGGVSPHNNPAFQLFMQATIDGYGYNFETGADKLFVLSLGTGCWATDLTNVVKKAKEPAFMNGLTALASLMNDSRELNELVMQWISKQTGPCEAIDSVVGNLSDQLMCGKPLCSYMRYNIRLEQKWLKDNLGKDYTGKEVKELRDLGSIDNMNEFVRLGQLYAQKMIKPEHIL